MKLKEAFESKGLKVNLGKTKVMVNGDMTKDGMSKSKVVSCGVCSLKVKANSVLRVLSGKGIHGICAGVKMLTPKIYRNFTCRRCEGNIGDVVKHVVKVM